MSKKKSGFGKFILGGAIGGALGLLFAPKKGSETRRELRVKLDELWCKAKEVDVDDVKAMFQKKVDEIKDLLEDLDTILNNYIKKYKNKKTLELVYNKIEIFLGNLSKSFNLE